MDSDGQKFSTGPTSQSNVGFMTEVRIVGVKHPDDFFALAYGPTREVSQARAEQIANALSPPAPAPSPPKPHGSLIYTVWKGG
jgi:hypothetical protein